MSSLKRVWIPSPNFSSRGGAGVRLVCLHTAEGARTIESLGGYFQGNVSASSHTGADDKVNTVGEFVKRDQKAWTCAEFNPVAVQIELCGFASWSQSEWLNNHSNMLNNCGLWIAEEAAHYGIPITKLTASEAQGSGRGVCQHVDLGARGGGHHDCGSGFPMDHVLDIARGGASPAQSKVGDMVASGSDANGGPHVFWVGSNRHQVFFKYQQGNDWKGGGLFAQLSENVTGLSCTVTNGDIFTVHARCDDGNAYYTWQSRGQTAWHGGGAGKIAGFTRFN
jgi:hypothetical protein